MARGGARREKTPTGTPVTPAMRHATAVTREATLPPIMVIATAMAMANGETPVVFARSFAAMPATCGPVTLNSRSEVGPSLSRQAGGPEGRLRGARFWRLGCLASGD